MGLMLPRFLSMSAAAAVLLVSITASTAIAKSAVNPTPNLGFIEFPNSGNRSAQAVFLTGVKALHNFEFEDASEAFLLAQIADPTFALAYWGEAMSLNQPLWARQDKTAALAVLGRFAPTPAARKSRIPVGTERGLMEAVDILYGQGDKLSRDIAYAEAMSKLHKTYPRHDEIATLYALSLLGTVRPGDIGFRRQILAGSIAMKVLERNPDHPGAAHFIIHAFDDPDHAILALPAALAYADIAPDASHALHMPSHIFLQLGMWDGVVASNDVSYKAALNHAEIKNISRGGSEYHALQWYHYGQLQRGNLEGAEWALDEALRTLEAFQTARVRNATMMIVARHYIETEKWAGFDFSMITDLDRTHANLQFAVGLSAAHRGQFDQAMMAIENLSDLRQKRAQNPSTAYNSKIIHIGEMELKAVLAVLAGDDAAAERHMIGAIEIEETLNAPSGPPFPMKPAFEMYGEFLVEKGRYYEAARQFNKVLERAPNRTKSIQGLEWALSNME
ncbi:MAG: hypothetical protein ACJZ9F_03980 [Rhodospirillaceae bacterium]